MDVPKQEPKPFPLHTYTAPWPPLWWLNPLFFKNQPNHHNCPTSTDPSRASPSFINTTSFGRFLHSLLSWRGRFCPTSPCYEQQQQTLVVLRHQHSEVPPSRVTLHLHNPTPDTTSKLLEYRGGFILPLSFSALQGFLIDNE